MLESKGWHCHVFCRLSRIVGESNTRGDAAAFRSAGDVVLTDGDVDRLVVVIDGPLTRLVVYSGGEDEPLVQAVLTPEERRRLVAALQQQAQPDPEE